MKAATSLSLRATTVVLASLVIVLANGSDYFLPGRLVLSRSVYDNNANNVQVGATLPPGCVPSAELNVTCGTATHDGTYPTVWNNDLADASFGITSSIFLDQLDPSDGSLINSLEVPNSSQNGVPPTKDQLVTSFPSKSELALNLSTDGRFITFLGYVAPNGALDVSNSNTPTIVDPTNPVPSQFYRAVAQVDQHGKFHFTKTEAYSGNNGRAAILNNTNGANVVYTAGNAGNGGDPQPDDIIIAAGAQILSPEVRAMVAQNPALPTPVGSFNIKQLPGAKYQAGDKVGKDTNFRGLRIYDQVLYYSKGSGGNGINTVYFVDTTAQACPTTTSAGVVTGGGVGVPQTTLASFTGLPTSAIAYDLNAIATKGVTPYNMCVLRGFPIDLKTKTFFPFGLWFADANTLYVADEGDGDTTFSTATGRFTKATVDGTGQTAAGVHPGLQKWVFDGTKWNRQYTLQAGLNLGIPYAYTITGYPTGNNDAQTKQPAPWTPATGGLRNITGRVNGDGTVTIWGITSTVSGNGDAGADPNQLVVITDLLAATTQPAGESFTILRKAGFGEVLRGISLTPGTSVAQP
jgi:hypothetical protein